MKFKVVLTLIFTILFSFLVREAECEYNFVSKWGSKGSGNGQLSTPSGLALSALGRVYVVDGSNHRIQKFNSSGNYISQWGSLGSGKGQFKGPFDIAVDGSGYVYVTDINNNRVQKFNSSGNYINQWGEEGSGNSQFKGPFGIAVDKSHNIYVADGSNYRIQKFDSSGAFIRKWGSFGTGIGQFKHPYGVAVDSSGNVYVIDVEYPRVQKFNSNGAFILEWGSKCLLSTSEGCIDPDGAGPLELGDGQFSGPTAIAVDSSGYVYVTDLSDRVQKFSSSGQFIEKWGTYCNLTSSNGCVDPDGGGPLVLGDGQFNNPHGIIVDKSGYVYVSGINNNRIQKFTRPERTLTVTLNGSGRVVSNPAGIDCTSSNTKTCSFDFNKDEDVGLVATPIDGAEYSSFFIGWSGDCSGSGPCLLTMDNDNTVEADFGALGMPVYLLPVPDGQDIYNYLPVETPVENPNPTLCKPFAVGDIAGGTLSLQVKLNQFADEVDIFLAISSDEIDPDNVYIIKSDNTFQTLAEGLVAWKANTTGPVDEALFGDIDISGLPSATFNLFIAVAPAGTLDFYYIWATYFVVP